MKKKRGRPKTGRVGKSIPLWLYEPERSALKDQSDITGIPQSRLIRDAIDKIYGIVQKKIAGGK